MKHYGIQLVSRDNDFRSGLVRYDIQTLYDALNESVDNDLHNMTREDLVIVIFEYPKPDADPVLSTRPLVTVDTFLEILQVELKND